MINQKTNQKIIEAKFGKGWEFLMDLTESNCEIYQREVEGLVIPEKLYCFYGGSRKGEMTKTPWKRMND